MANTTIPSELIQANVALSGSPTTTTQSAGNNTTKVATTAFVTAAVNALVDSAPGTMNTLNEIAAALNDDASFNTTVTNAIATKLPLGGGTMTGNITVNDNVEIQFGTGGDYKFDYNGSRLNVIGTGDLVADISGDFYFDADGGDLFFQDGGSAKGSISMANSDITLTASADDLILAAADNIHLICQGNESGIDITGNGAVSLYHDNDLTFQTTSDGVQIGRNNDGAVKLQLYGTTGADHKIFFGNDGTNGHKDGAIRYFGEANGTTANRRAMTFSTANTEQVRIDASGNMGIHQDSPSSFNAAARDLVIGNSTGDHGISIRAATNGQSALYAVDGTGGTAGYRGRLIYDHAGDRWDIHSAAVMRMRINGTGEVHITSAGVPIDPTIKHGGATGDVAKLRLINRSGQAANKGGALELGGVTNDGVSRSDVFGAVAGLKESSGSANREGYLQFSVSTGSALSEMMRIDGAGNVKIGTTNNYGSRLLAYTEAASNRAFTAEANTGSYTDAVIDASCTRNSANATYRLYQGQRRGTAVVWSVNDAGNAQNTNNSFTGLSDQRLKINIADAGSQWNDIKALRVRTYQWGMGNTGHTQLGVVSQEVEASGMNGLIDEAPADEYQIAYDSSLEGQNIKSVKYSVLYMKAVKALQEAITKIEALEARVTTLEG